MLHLLPSACLPLLQLLLLSLLLVLLPLLLVLLPLLLLLLPLLGFRARA